MFNWLPFGSRKARPAAKHQAHLTFGATSVGRSLSRTGLLLKKQLWIWPIIAVVLLALVGYSIRIAIERTMRASLESQLHTLLNVEHSMLETWLKIQQSNAQSLANDQQVRELTSNILAAKNSAPPPTASSPPVLQSADNPTATAVLHAALANELNPGMTAHNFVGYILASKDFRIVSSSSAELVGLAVGEYEPFLADVFEGKVVVTTPFASRILMKDERGAVRTGVPTMFAFAPVLDSNLQVIAALGLRIRPEREFTRILSLGQLGESGETYAINKDGLLTSSSRFDDKLILLGLIPDVEGAQSILTVQARDPGGDMSRGFRPNVRRAELPLTKSAASAVTGAAGIDLDGYRDYRGVSVVGAWRWLPDAHLGLITEIDYAEAYRPLMILRWAFFSIFGLLAASSIAIFVFTLVVARLQREAQKAAIEAKQLGQYRLEEKLGAGAMGVVYKGQHAMLRRPTAIKMLNVDKVNETSIQRFEREVQLTCKLNNPSTVAIYDYGRTPEGVFYYAMEYLDGIDLQELIDRYGAQPEGRVIRILQAVCSSLYEAHSLGLVHRDIKPANLMLNRRGGEPDVMKVLDFGLVRALDEGKTSRQTGGLAGTPLYMSPESIQSPDSVDPRSDIYAVGAVGYFLITGRPVFEASTLVELCQQHITAVPVSPSEKAGKAVSPELESALLACLDKNRSKRPQTARDLSNLLHRVPTAGSWSVEDADAWWSRHERAQAAAASGPPSRQPSPSPGGTLVDAATTPADTSTAAPSPTVTRTASSGFDQTIATSSRDDLS